MGLVIEKITDDLFVSPQIHTSDIETLKAQGFENLIINRPDDEGKDQTNYAEIATAAQADGLTTHYIPVRPGSFDAESVAAFSNALRSSGKTLAYCKTGMRARKLWSLSNGDATMAGTILGKLKRLFWA